LRNAVQAIRDKGGAAGTIEISTAVASSARIPSAVTISIHDNGVGIPRDHFANIFQAGFTTRNGASGLGLFIAKRIAEKNGGSISLESTLGTGTRVVVSIPLKRHAE
jgi:signal transduction histidine kinase